MIVIAVLLARSTFAGQGAALTKPMRPDADPNRVIQDVCVTCHNATTLLGNLSLEDFDVYAAEKSAEVAEKVIRKLRAEMMPPPGIPRPDEAALSAVYETLEARIDAAALRDPNPGARSFQRLNRTEYENAIRDLLELDVDASDWLPLDQMSANFDNMADAQTLSPMLLESYLNAASDISRMAVGDRNAPAVDVTYSNSIYVSQHPWDQLEGAPYGTRGGMVVDHAFPADAEYVFELTFASGDNAQLEDVDVSIDGERVALIPYAQSEGGADGRGAAPMSTEPVLVRAGQRRVAAAFIRRTDGPYEDLIRPHDWSFAGGGSGGSGITTLPHLRSLVIKGPYDATGLSDTPSRKRIFSCRPTSPVEERPCAEEIVTRLGGEAYRRSLSAGDLEGLMEFYDLGASKGGFEIGVRMALEAILASPYFALRLETEPSGAPPGQGYRIGDLDLASRLSFFLWGTPPDGELQRLASEGRLSDPGELDRQTRRMLADPRAEALGTRFSALWLRLQDLYKVRPDPNYYPNFDENLADAMRRETELFFYNLVREDRSVLELFTADYTFVNERLARHYGFPGVAGSTFRRVAYPDDTRRGILGHGSVLVLTSMANRTSPVLRGKWVMEVLMGTPPPPPPPNVPDLEQTEGVSNGRILTTRERLELHRSDPTCRSCHRLMDPIGLALDNFDVTAKWRTRESGMPLDTHGEFYDGTPVSTPAELVEALLRRPEILVRNFAENLLAYALGRRVEYSDQPTIRAIARKAEANDYRASSFIIGVVGSDAFQMKRADPMTTDEATTVHQP
ncbi:MAG TPA: DUF1592 domain-containing protein [Vicinamibacteria bacterium]|nr:DUF1592 domain-containing protein [Vicinamibacteria bacterium]